MKDLIVKGNTALVLFAIKNAEIHNKGKELITWHNFVNSFHFDDDAICNLVFINHPIENFIGISIRCKAPLLEEKAKRYSEGLAFLLTRYFGFADIRVLSQEEAIAVVENISSLNGIPHNLCSLDASHKLCGPQDKLKLLFVRVINPQVVLDKVNEFYGVFRKNHHSLEARVGVKPVWDERLLSVLPNSFMAYSFGYYSEEKARDKVVTEAAGILIPRPVAFVSDFIDEMGVPDVYIDKIIDAKSSSELLDNPDISLVSPKTVAEFILGYR